MLCKYPIPGSYHVADHHKSVDIPLKLAAFDLVQFVIGKVRLQALQIAHFSPDLQVASCPGGKNSYRPKQTGIFQGVIDGFRDKRCLGKALLPRAFVFFSFQTNESQL
jgi:hypothetical protein